MNASDPFVITSRERLKYEDQFKSLQPVDGVVTGGQAKGFFLQSQLPPQILGQIWALADTDADGRMTLGEFSIACKLINLKLRGFEVPKALPPTLIASLTAVGGTPILTPTSGLSPLDPLKSLSGSIGVVPQPQPPLMAPHAVPHAIVPPLMNNQMGVAPQTVVPGMGPGGVPPPKPALPPQLIAASAAGPPLIPMGQPLIPGMAAPVQAAVMQQPLIGGLVGSAPTIPPTAAVKPLIDPLGSVSAVPLVGGVAVPAPPTPPHSGGGTPARSMSISERAPSIESPGQIEWAIKGPAKLKYTQLFNTTDRNRSGFLTGPQARNIMVQTKLPQAMLAQIWALADMDTDGRLGCEEFVLAMYLCDMAAAGEKVPTTLPPELVPPSFRKATSRHGSVVGSRHGSVSSQGAPVHAAVELDPLSGLPQSSFEDKRKENFDKGQAELERRRKALMDIQKKEQEERERKEREEQEKIRKAKLEAELKKQQELEKELQRQRELEQEREEQRKRELEKKELARKEMEKQRQLEWETQKIAEMQQHRQREQENVLKLKAQNQSLSVELSTFNERIKELSQKICDTRVGVTNVKSTIDGMRTTRDTQMAEMTQLKAQVKEQNQRLVQLSQEKAKLDAKSKSGETESQLQFTNKQIVIQQLKDKLENTKQQIENKTTDINLNRDQLVELKSQLTDLIDACEQLYGEYDMQRIQILEMKNNRKNESYSSAWDTSNSWGAPDTTTTHAALNSEPAAPAASVTAGSGEDVQTPPGYVKYRAIYEFSARNSDEISFQPGDIVMVPLEQNAEPGWLAGEINGHTGWFPESFVEKVDSNLNVVEAVPETIAYSEPEVDYTTTTTTTTTIAASAAAAAPVEEEYHAPNDNTEATCNGDVEYYVACYAYQSAEAGDLVFDAGETIAVSKKEGDWWTGTIGNRTGIFPSNYVQKHEGEVMNGNQATYNEQPTMHQEPEQQQQQQPQAYEQETKRKQSATAAGNTQDAEDARNQAEADSEVSQINTQPPSGASANEENIRYSSMSMTSATPSLRRKGEVAQVIAPYEATSSEQLSLQRGQLIMIRKKTDSGWWEGELQAKGRRRQIGWFPATYVKILQGGRNSGRNTPVSASKVELTETILDKVIALYPYKALNDDELSFEKDDIISVLGRDEPEWWRGELNGTTGLFPSNYVGPFVSSGKNGKSPAAS
uniref:ITSN1 n=1 Tax=Anopheles coluzzii TaxID=1518534 RepID=A0A6E8VXN3_ANOCL|nr:intersectin-1 isoform X1 [Anopheles coluzzii]XP_040238467.2 intersectin-1 isoform X1 [Anopheles coluzzii]XP_040238468.2 intersectin-1 isoform X1 [Anopheles coluzzii]XP_040238469.2 intersectin-1 isoform X1 [Anopheles coluzzii]XP_040238470.2 intersectin-1 isoform X1 [Anopheles coluzzii]